MSEPKSVTDISSVAAMSAVAAVGISTTYFYNRLKTIDDELAQIKAHLSTVIQAIDPQNKLKIDQIVTAIRTLDNRVAKTQKEVQMILETEIEPKEEDQSEAKRPYQRLTPPAKVPKPVFHTDRSARTTTYRSGTRKGRPVESSSESSSEENYDEDEDNESQSESEELSDDVQDAIAAMQ